MGSDPGPAHFWRIHSGAPPIWERMTLPPISCSLSVVLQANKFLILSGYDSRGAKINLLFSLISYPLFPCCSPWK